MSSILRALKKLENEPKHLEETRALDSKFVPLADTGPARKPAGLFFMFIGGAMVFGLVVIAGVWWLFSEKEPLTPKPPQEIARQKTEAAPVTPEKSAEQPKTEPGAVAETSPLTPATPAADHMDTGQTADRIPEPKPVILPQPSTPTIGQRKVLSIAEQSVESVSLSPEIQTSENVEPETAEKASAPAASPPQITIQQMEKVEIPVLKNTEMKLQAITWSKDPQKRIAIINNTILRQGETVSGYRIEIINQDDVVLNDRGKKWKLLFRIR